jgi:antitoxin YefM
MDSMRTLSSTQLRAKLSAVMDQVNDDHEPVIVPRAKGKPVVMVSLEDWASMDETTYLLSSPANARRLMQGIEELKAGKDVPHDLIEERTSSSTRRAGRTTYIGRRPTRRPCASKLAGFWSRRIDREHRLVYMVTATAIEIAQCRYHY